MKSPGRFPCFSDRERIQSKRLGYGFFMRLEEKSVLTSKIDLIDQACCICIKPDVCPEDSLSKREKTMTRHLLQ
jgi:hypothetical protein